MKPLLLGFTVIVATVFMLACETPQHHRTQPVYRVDPDAVVVQRAFVALSDGKKIADIFQKGDITTTRSDGTYYVHDERGLVVGWIAGSTGAVGRMRNNSPENTGEVVDVTSDFGLAQAVAYLMQPGGNVFVVSASQYAGMAK